MQEVDGDGPIYRDAAGDGGELRRAIRHSCCGLRPPGELIFHPGETGWDQFYLGVFARRVVPHLGAVVAAATAGQLDRVVAAEVDFSADLEPGVGRRLAGAGAAVSEARAGARSMRLLERLFAARPGCTFTTAFGVHAAAFNVPVLHALLAYLYVEWRAGWEGAGLVLEKASDWEDRFLGQLGDSPEPVRRVLAGGLGGWAEVA